jgi:hypothetical protein
MSGYRSSSPTSPSSETEIISLTKNGTWLADGREISHELTRKLFARSIQRDSDGYFIRVGFETRRIQVEDTPYFVHRIEIERDPAQRIERVIIELNDESRERLDPRTLNFRQGRLTCRVKSKAEEARFLHASYFELLQDLQEDSLGYFLLIGGDKITLESKESAP